MRKRKLSRAERDQLAEVAAMPDDRIDTADIPEAPAESWIEARRGGLHRPVEKRRI